MLDELRASYPLTTVQAQATDRVVLFQQQQLLLGDDEKLPRLHDLQGATNWSD